jgi:beta-phosphoglucomutase-like phosphatase (HAD superfamily)
MSALPQPERELDTVACHWQWALDADDRALDAAGRLFASDGLTAEHRALVVERREIASVLARVARARGIEPEPWLPVTHVSLGMLGLPPETQACIFDLDGVLTDSGVLHATAWADALDPLLLDVAHSTGRAFVPFDRDEDYRLYFDGRGRVEGIHLFLASRGLQLPEGHPDDTAAALSVVGVARHKGELLGRVLHLHGISALAGARRYLQAVRYAHLPSAVVSASATTLPMLRIALLEHLIDVRADAETMRREGLHSRPSPDLLVAACDGLGIEPEHAVSLTHSGAGVVAAQRLGMPVIGVAPEARATELRAFGAPVVVPSLASLLLPPLRRVEAAERPRTWT